MHFKDYLNSTQITVATFSVSSDRKPNTNQLKVSSLYGSHKGRNGEEVQLRAKFQVVTPKSVFHVLFCSSISSELVLFSKRPCPIVASLRQTRAPVNTNQTVADGFRKQIFTSCSFILSLSDHKLQYAFFFFECKEHALCCHQDL